jgi:hypothetical protein
MYTYRYVNSFDRKPVPARFKELDDMIRIYFDTSRDVKKNPQEAMMANTVYMWTPQLPLQRYKELQFKKDSTTEDLKKWAAMGPLYGDYGKWLILNYPLQFLRYFLWPNANKFYAPTIEYLGVYNAGVDTVPEIAKVWFGYESHKVVTQLKDKKIIMFNFYPILTGIANAVFILSVICFIWTRGLKENPFFSKGVVLALAVWILNSGFTIFASSVALRFQAFPILLTIAFSSLLVDWFSRLSVGTQNIETINQDLFYIGEKTI